MNDAPNSPPPVPFGLHDAAALAQVEVSYAFYSSRTGAGRQELTISGAGVVTLFFSRNYKDPQPQVRTGATPPGLVLRLLDVMQCRGFLDLDEVQAAPEHAHARRTVRLRLPGAEKTVHLDHPGVYAVEQIVGAIVLTAAYALPEVLGHRFFLNLG